MEFAITVVEHIYSWQILKSDGNVMAQGTNSFSSVEEALAEVNEIRRWALSAPVAVPDKDGVTHVRSSNA